MDFYINVFPDILFLVIDLGNFNSTLFNFFTARHFMSLSVAVSTNFVLVPVVLVPVELSASIACACRFFLWFLFVLEEDFQFRLAMVNFFYNGFYLYLRGTFKFV